jgi:hypothetical protein
MDDRERQKMNKNYKNIQSRNDNRNETRNVLSENEGLLNTKSSIFKSNTGIDTHRKRELKEIHENENDKSINFVDSINLKPNKTQVLNNSMKENIKTNNDHLFLKQKLQSNKQSLHFKLNNTESSKIVIKIS